MNLISDKIDEKVYTKGNEKFNYIWTVRDIGRDIRPNERTWAQEPPHVWRVTSMMGISVNTENPEVITTMQCFYDTNGNKTSVRIQSFGGERIKTYDYDYGKLVFIEGFNVEEVSGRGAYIEGSAIVKDKIIYEDKIYLWDEKRKAFLDSQGIECQNKMLSHPELLSKFLSRIEELENEVKNSLQNNDENINL